MTLGYRSIYTVPGRRNDVVPVALAQLHAWLLHKRLDPTKARLGQRSVVGDGAELTLQELEGGDESRSLRVRLVEKQQRGTWTTSLTVHIPGDAERDPWMWLDVDAPDGQPWTARPKLAELLLSVFDGQEGSAALRSTPQVIQGPDVPQLLATILDPDRSRLVFVAGSDAQMPIDRWVSLLEQLLRETVGLAAAYVLDAGATAALERLLGLRHAVAPGTVRTFAPRVELRSDVDAIRHRVLSTERIVRGDARAIARALGVRARETVVDRPLPRAVTRIDRALERQLDELVLHGPMAGPSIPNTVADLPAASAAPPPSLPAVSVPPTPEPALVRESMSEVALEDTTVGPKPSGLAPSAPTVDPDVIRSVRSALTEVLGHTEVTVAGVTELADLARIGIAGAERREQLARRLDDVRTQLAVAEDERDELRRQLEDEQLDHAETLQERIDADQLAQHLRKLVLKASPQTDVWTSPEAAEAPTSFDELLEMATDLVSVDCSGLDAGIARELDEHDQLGSWARKTWEMLLTLSDYARASTQGACERDVDGYLRHTHDGYRTYPANRHARDESEDVKTNPGFWKSRVLPVPKLVKPEGEVFMGAHFKIAQRGRISPRLHYYDATAVDGVIYVGYIGRHLPTQQSN